MELFGSCTGEHAAETYKSSWLHATCIDRQVQWAQIIAVVFYLPLLSAFFDEPAAW